MAMRPVTFPSSNNIQDVAYDEETQTLTVLFHSGAVYEYSGVPGNDADGFGQAFSASDYLKQSIIPRYGSGRRIS